MSRFDSSTSQLADDVQDFSANGNSLALINKSEIDMQIATAKRYPRSIARAKDDMLAMATIDQETAERCGYALKRTDQKTGEIVWIEGPSIRMAEIAVSCWGNLRYGARVIEENDRFIVAQGMCYDLEKNIASSMETRRRITGRGGRKYSDDMVGTTANAACAIAARNAVFKIIPMAIVRNAYEAAMKTAGGDSKTFTQRRQAAWDATRKLGATPEEIMRVLGKPDGGMDDLDAKDLRRLFGLITAINDGETTVEQVFRPQKDAAESSKQRASELDQRLGASPPPTQAEHPTAPQSTASESTTHGAEQSESSERKAEDIAGTSGEKGQTGASGESDQPNAESKPDTDDDYLSRDWADVVAFCIAEAKRIDPSFDGTLVNSWIGAKVLSIRHKGKENQINIKHRRAWLAEIRNGRAMAGGAA